MHRTSPLPLSISLLAAPPAIMPVEAFFDTSAAHGFRGVGAARARIEGSPPDGLRPALNELRFARTFLDGAVRGPRRAAARRREQERVDREPVEGAAVPCGPHGVGHLDPAVHAGRIAAAHDLRQVDLFRGNGGARTGDRRYPDTTPVTPAPEREVA